MVQEYFNDLSRQLGPSGLSWDNIRRAYAGRPYHNLDHLAEMIGYLHVTPPPHDPQMFAAALLYHDIVYKPTRIDNEARSARSVGKALQETPSVNAERIERCRRLVMATKRHLPSPTDDGDEALLIDLDLAVLARQPAAYDRYTDAVRQEFWMLPFFVFRKGRNKVITELLNRPQIFTTAYGREHFEAQARENLWRELRVLQA